MLTIKKNEVTFYLQWSAMEADLFNAITELEGQGSRFVCLFQNGIEDDKTVSENLTRGRCWSSRDNLAPSSNLRKTNEFDINVILTSRMLNKYGCLIHKFK